MPVQATGTELHLVVTDRTTHGDDVAVLELARPDGAPLPEWSPGAHVDLVLGPDLVRQYSLCGDPHDRSTWRVAVLREAAGRGGSLLAHALVPGAGLDVRGPRNHFPLVDAPRYLFIAGGIGITPIVTMIAQAGRRGADWQLVYGGRTRAGMAFRAELEQQGGDRVVIHPEDEAGLIDLDRVLADPQPGTAVYACGPEALLDAIEDRMREWPAGALHVERFTPRAVGEPARTGAFEVELAQSGLLLTVPPDRSILDVVTDSGIDVASSCAEGTCGTCETVVLAGRPDHRDSLLSAQEQESGDTMMICVSRSADDRLVLDL